MTRVRGGGNSITHDCKNWYSIIDWRSRSRHDDAVQYIQLDASGEKVLQQDRISDVS